MFPPFGGKMIKTGFFDLCEVEVPAIISSPSYVNRGGLKAGFYRRKRKPVLTTPKGPATTPGLLVSAFLVTAPCGMLPRSLTTKSLIVR